MVSRAPPDHRALVFTFFVSSSSSGKRVFRSSSRALLSNRHRSVCSGADVPLVRVRINMSVRLIFCCRPQPALVNWLVNTRLRCSLLVVDSSVFRGVPQEAHHTPLI